MYSDEGKLFIGGIAWDTTEETLSDYFTKYGVVSQTVIMRDKTTGRPRGFGFVVFSDPSVLDSVLQDRHTIEGRTVEAKRALSREEQQTSRSGNNFGRRSGNYRTKKIFVGGLPSTLTEEQFRQYFGDYGEVTDVVIMFDQNTNRPRGFGFVSFDTEDAVDRVLQKTFHELNNKLVEVKQALPKDENHDGSGGRSGGYQDKNAGSFDSQMDGSRFMHQQTTGSGGGYPQYSSYGQPTYGYGGYANYGGPSGMYGNPSGLKAQWGGQSPGYGGAGYDPNVGYGVWNAAGGGPAVSEPMSQSAGGASGYGGQAYGYGNYGSHDGYNTNLGGYGAGGAPSGNQQGAGDGYNGQIGYSNGAWRSDS